MKLDATDLRYITSEEFRVLVAVEVGSKNHHVVPTPLVAQLAALRSGGTNKLLGALAKRNLVAKVQNSKYDGYRLTYGGYDHLALRALSKRESISSVGNQIGVGKEADVYAVADGEGNEMALKLHKLGRVSFRAVKQKRDYLGKRTAASWMYISRLAAQKEWAFINVLYEHGFPVPRPIDCARHCILMEVIDAYPLRQITDLPEPGKLYSELMSIIVRLAHAGLIHGDLNEFNVLVRRESGEPVVIDFPQMVSVEHENAEWYFERDVDCVRSFFRRRFKYETAQYPRFRVVMAERSRSDAVRLDAVVAASGFAKGSEKVLRQYMEAVKAGECRGSECGASRRDDEASGASGQDDEEDEEEEEEGRGRSGRQDDGDECESEDGDESEDEGEPVVMETGAPSVQPPNPDEARADPGNPNPNPDRSPDQPADLGRSADPDAETWRGRERDDEDEDALSQLSRSPPRSRSPSPSTLAKMAAALSLRDHAHSSAHGDASRSSAGARREGKDVCGRVAADLARRGREQKRYHARRGTARAGRAAGSKAKQDQRVRVLQDGW